MRDSGGDFRDFKPDETKPTGEATTEEEQTPGDLHDPGGHDDARAPTLPAEPAPAPPVPGTRPSHRPLDRAHRPRHGAHAMTPAARIEPASSSRCSPCSTLVAAPALGAARTLNGAKDNEAVAQPSAAGDSVIDLAFSVRETASDVIDETQHRRRLRELRGVPRDRDRLPDRDRPGPPSTVTPQNVALAVNEGCRDCSVLALAYQWVVGRGEPVEFTRRGLARLAAVRLRLSGCSSGNTAG